MSCMNVRHLLGNAIMSIKVTVDMIREGRVERGIALDTIETDLARLNAALCDCKQDRLDQCWSCLSRWMDAKREILRKDSIDKEELLEIFGRYDL